MAARARSNASWLAVRRSAWVPRKAFQIVAVVSVAAIGR